VRILISAGEASGDLHAADVVKALGKQSSDIEISGIAGERMKKAGCQELVPMAQLNTMGLSDVIAALPRIRRAEKTVLEWASVHQPDVAILVDYPGLHMRMGRHLRRLGIPVLHYIAPKLWSWGVWRARRLARSQDKLACILPFEPEWFARHGISAAYVGNPTAATSHGGWSRAELCERYDLKQGEPVLALLPGSRPGEIQRHAPLLGGLLAALSKRMPTVQFVAPRAPGVSESSLLPLTEKGAILVDRTADGYALRADAAVAVSGTATLELALWDVPTVLIYRSTPLTIAIARLLATVECIGLANILLGQRKVMPELIQDDCTLDGIISHLAPLLQGGDAAQDQRNEFARLRQILGEADPAAKVARMAINMTGNQAAG